VTMTPNPSIEPTSKSLLRKLSTEAHVERWRQKMRRLVRPALWIVCAAVVVWACYFFLRHYDSQPFLEGAMGNLFATMLGVVVGIPVALQIAQHQQSAAEIASRQAAVALAQARKHAVASHLLDELRSNRVQVLECRAPLENGAKRSVLTHPLRTELWQAFSDSGELQYINNPQVLALLAKAFHQTKATARMEQLLLELTHFPGLRVTGSHRHDETVLE
jgi:hypothetical protein